MTEKKLNIGTDQEANAEVTAAEKKKGSQRIDIAVWVDNNSAAIFTLPERVVKHFKIDPKPDGMPEEVAIYGTGGKKGDKRPIDGVTISRPGQKIMKVIRVPCGTTEPIKIKRGGKEVNVKELLVRIPSAMNLNAIAVWINTCFKQNKPDYIRTEKNIKAYIVKTYNDKSKLKALKEAK